MAGKKKSVECLAKGCKNVAMPMAKGCKKHLVADGKWTSYLRWMEKNKGKKEFR